MEYLYNINNYVDQASLNNHLPYKALWGETKYISMIRFKFWETVYFQNLTDKSGEVLMHPGIFSGFAWNFINSMDFKVLQLNTNPYKRNMVVHRGVVIPRNLSAMVYNSALAPNSDAYFPEVHLEGVPTSKPDTPGQQTTMDTPNIDISEGGGKQHKTSSSPLAGINQAEVDQPFTES